MGEEIIITQKIRYSKELGGNLRSLRIKVGLTQEETVIKMELMGCKTTREIYSQMEMGVYNIRINELKALKEIFHTSYDRIFESYK